jgi:hypothetical protein
VTLFEAIKDSMSNKTTLLAYGKCKGKDLLDPGILWINEVKTDALR